MLTEEQAIEATIKHWETMIAYAKTRLASDFVSSSEMVDDIETTWTGVFCALCQRKIDTANKVPCPLIGKICSGRCHPFWYDVTYSATWKEWIRNANKLLEEIRYVQSRSRVEL